MRKTFLLTRYLSLFFVLSGLVIGGFYQVNAQSQALNGQIEGIITDANSAAVPNATITARNTQTGTERTTTSDASGVYRFPLLPLGSYRVTVEATSFKRLVRDGIILTTVPPNAALSDRCLPAEANLTARSLRARPARDTAARISRPMTTKRIQSAAHFPTPRADFKENLRDR